MLKEKVPMIHFLLVELNILIITYSVTFQFNFRRIEE